MDSASVEQVFTASGTAVAESCTCMKNNRGMHNGTASVTFATQEQATEIKLQFDGQEVGQPPRVIKIYWDRFKNQPDDEEGAPNASNHKV